MEASERRKMEKTEQEKSQAIYDEIVLGMKEWRVANPKAPMREIEREARERVSILEAHLITEHAMDSASCDWGGRPADERPQCPSCSEALGARGKHVRKLQATAGREVKLERTYGVCPQCGTGFFPP